jgi:hypothetical protein
MKPVPSQRKPVVSRGVAWGALEAIAAVLLGGAGALFTLLLLREVLR